MKLHEKIKCFRVEQGLTQREFGTKLGVSEKAVSKWENGNASIPSEKLPLIADLFGVNTDALFGRTHDLTADLQSSLANYMETVPSAEAIRTMQELISYMMLGAQVRSSRDSGCYRDEVLTELKAEWEALIRLNDERPQRFFCEESADVLHDFQNGSADHYQSDDLSFTVLQRYPDDMFGRILKRYEAYADVFAFLALPDAQKLLEYRYSKQMPSDFTVDELASASGASKETVNAFLALNECDGEPATLDGVQTLLYTKPTVMGAQSALQTVIAAAYAFVEKRKGGHR